MQRRFLVGLLLGLSLATSGCAWLLSPFRVVPAGLNEIARETLPLLIDDGDRDSLRIALERSVEFYERHRERTFRAAGYTYTGSQFSDSLRQLLGALPYVHDTLALDAVVRSNFRILRVTGKRPPVRFTGYYTPIIRGSLQPNDIYRYPVYGRPADLLTLEVGQLGADCPCAPRMWTGRLDGEEMRPYYTRADIDRRGVLRDRGLEIAWVADPVRLFFLHVQGSGRMVLPDGSGVQLNYAATNGLPFQSVGRVLADRGALPPGGGSMQLVRTYLLNHPAERQRILEYNQRYTFFRIAETGPQGSTDVEVTAGRTIATDTEIFPPGALTYIRTRIPAIDDNGGFSGWRPFRRFMLNQDSGAAIKGHGRVDIYFGEGDSAEHVAGRMSAEGDLFVFVPAAASIDRSLTALAGLR